MFCFWHTVGLDIQVKKMNSEKIMKCRIICTLLLFATGAFAGSSASHAVRIVILQPNQFEVSLSENNLRASGVDVQRKSRSDFTLNWRTSSPDKRITVAALSGGTEGILKVKHDRTNTERMRLDDSHRELTDHLTDRQGRVNLQWLTQYASHSDRPAGIVYTLTDSL